MKDLRREFDFINSDDAVWTDDGTIRAADAFLIDKFSKSVSFAVDLLSHGDAIVGAGWDADLATFASLNVDHNITSYFGHCIRCCVKPRLVCGLTIHGAKLRKMGGAGLWGYSK